MTQRAALLLAAALTICVLILGAGVVAFADKRSPDPNPTVATGAVDAALQESASVRDLERLVQQRDAHYRTEIEQANTQLQQAYETIRTLQAQNQDLQQRETVYRQSLEEAIRYIQFIQNQSLRFGVNPDAFAGERDEHHD